VTFRFYANMTTLHSGICYRKSVCPLSVVCNVRAPQSAGWNFPQCFNAISNAFRWTSCILFRRSSQENPSYGLNARLVAKYSDFGHVEGYISETVPVPALA